MRQQRPSQRIGHFNMKKETNQQSHHIQKKKVVHLSRMSKTRSRKKKREKSGWKMHIKKYLAYWLIQIQTTLTCVCTPSLSSREFSPGPPDGSITKIQKGEDQPSIASGHQCQPRPKEEAEKVTYARKLKDFLSASGDRPKTNPPDCGDIDDATIPPPPMQGSLTCCLI